MTENPMTEVEKVVLKLVADNDGVLATNSITSTDPQVTDIEDAVLELAKRNYLTELKCVDGNYLVVKKAGWIALKPKRDPIRIQGV